MDIFSLLVEAVVVIGAENMKSLTLLPPHEDVDSVAYAPKLLDCVPQSKASRSIIRDISMFCLPDGVSLSRKAGDPKGSMVVLTDEYGEHLYGSCLTFFDALNDSDHTVIDEKQNGDKDESDEILYCTKCICILSRKPLFYFFQEYLTQLYALIFRDQILAENERNDHHLNFKKLNKKPQFSIERFISNLVFEIPMVPPGPDIILQVSAPFSSLDLSFNTLSDLPEFQIPLKTLFTCLDKENVLRLFTAVLLERKILFTSSSNNLLTTVAESIYALTYPFYWGYVYIPLLPPSLSECTEAPTPYIMGINKQYFSKIDKQLPILFVDLDNNKIINNGDPLPPLPPKEKDILLSQILPLVYPEVYKLGEIYPFGKPRYSSEEMEALNKLTDRKIRLSFLIFFISILSRFTEFLGEPTTDEDVNFEDELFLEICSEDSKEFLEQFLETHSFYSFLKKYTENCQSLGIFKRIVHLITTQEMTISEIHSHYVHRTEPALRISINDPTLISSSETIYPRKCNSKIACLPRFEEQLFIQSPNLKSIVDQIDIYLLSSHSVQLHLFKASLLAQQNDIEGVLEEYAIALEHDNESISRQDVESVLQHSYNTIPQLNALIDRCRTQFVCEIAKQMRDRLEEQEKEKQLKLSREKQMKIVSPPPLLKKEGLDIPSVIEALRSFSVTPDICKRSNLLSFLHHYSLLDDEIAAQRLLDLLCKDTRGVSVPPKTLEDFITKLHKMYNEVNSLFELHKKLLEPDELPLYSHPISSMNARKEKFLLTTKRLIFMRKKKKSASLSLSEIEKVESLNYQIILPPGVACMKIFAKHYDKYFLFSFYTHIVRDNLYQYILELMSATRMATELRDKRILTTSFRNIILSESVDKRDRKKKDAGSTGNIFYFGDKYPNASWFTISNKLTSLGMLNITPDFLCEEEVHDELTVISNLLTDAGRIFFEYVEEDGQHVNFELLKKSDGWKLFFQLSCTLQKVDISKLNKSEKTFFFINLYNVMVIHSYIECGTFPTCGWDWRFFERMSYYSVGGVAYSIGDIHHGLLRNNQKAPWDEEPYFFPEDPRKNQINMMILNPRILFLLANHTEISPWMFKLNVENIDESISIATGYYCQENISFEGNTITLSRLFYWFQSDFGNSVNEVLTWLYTNLQGAKKKNLKRLLEENNFEIRWTYSWIPCPKPLRGEV